MGPGKSFGPCVFPEDVSKKKTKSSDERGNKGKSKKKTSRSDHDGSGDTDTESSTSSNTGLSNVTSSLSLSNATTALSSDASSSNANSDANRFLVALRKAIEAVKSKDPNAERLIAAAIVEKHHYVSKTNGPAFVACELLGPKCHVDMKDALTSQDMDVLTSLRVLRSGNATAFCLGFVRGVRARSARISIISLTFNGTWLSEVLEKLLTLSLLALSLLISPLEYEY